MEIVLIWVLGLVVGTDGNHLNPIFLNLMSTLTSRAGTLYIRIGGNTQDKATVLPDGLPDGRTIEKAEEFTSTVRHSGRVLPPFVL